MRACVAFKMKSCDNSTVVATSINLPGCHFPDQHRRDESRSCFKNNSQENPAIADDYEISTRSEIVQVDERNLNIGDHIFVRRRGLLYSHHGIYAGDRTVIHFKGLEQEKRNPEVIVTNIDDFLKSGKLRRRNYHKRLTPSKTVTIARQHLSKKGYSLAFNNCEHFATYCVTGKKKSKQVRRAASGIIGVALAFTAAVISKKKSRQV